MGDVIKVDFSNKNKELDDNGLTLGVDSYLITDADAEDQALGIKAGSVVLNFSGDYLSLGKISREEACTDGSTDFFINDSISLTANEMDNLCDLWIAHRFEED